MCEPDMLARTGLTAREHQLRTVRNFLELQYLRSGRADSPFMPVCNGGPPCARNSQAANMAITDGVNNCHRQPASIHDKYR